MIQTSDVLILLSELGRDGINVDEQMSSVLTGANMVDTLKFIKDHKDIDAINFYNKIRKSYNDNKSKLYINILKEIDDPKEVLSTLSALELQIILSGKKINNPVMFYKVMRLEEILECLLNYSKTYDILPCIDLIKKYKADILMWETVEGRR